MNSRPIKGLFYSEFDQFGPKPKLIAMGVLIFAVFCTILGFYISYLPHNRANFYGDVWMEVIFIGIKLAFPIMAVCAWYVGITMMISMRRLTSFTDARIETLESGEFTTRTELISLFASFVHPSQGQHRTTQFDLRVSFGASLRKFRPILYSSNLLSFILESENLVRAGDEETETYWEKVNRFWFPGVAAGQVSLVTEAEFIFRIGEQIPFLIRIDSNRIWMNDSDKWISNRPLVFVSRK